MKKLFIICLYIFAIDSFADDVGLTWYDGDTTIDGASSCTVGGTFTPPTPPARDGYIFVGWKVKPNDCGVRSLDASIGGIDYGYIGLNGSSGSGTSTYGLTSGSGKWAVRFSYGVVWGKARCSGTGTQNNPWNNATLPTSDWVKILTDSGGRWCWCQVTGFSSSGSDYTQGPQCTTATSSWWINYNEYSTNVGCVDRCAYACASGVHATDKNSYTYSRYRIALFGAVGQ